MHQQSAKDLNYSILFGDLHALIHWSSKILFAGKRTGLLLFIPC